MLWLFFVAIVLIALYIDLGVLHKKVHAIKGKEAYIWSFFWIALSLVFNFFVYLTKGHESALLFFTAYVVEKSLSIDNIFIFAIIFTYLNIPVKYQHKVLFYGVIGAFVMRMGFIFLGSYLITHFEWLLYIFGLFLLFLAFQLLQKQKIYDPEKSWVIQIARKVFPLTPEIDSGRFFVRKNKKTYITPLFLALLLAEATDFIAALDSIPAVFVITTDPFLVYTSNIFALLGLRSLYFVVIHALKKLRYLNMGLAGVLIFLSCKMLLSGFYTIPVLVSFSVVALILGSAIFFSLKKKSH